MIPWERIWPWVIWSALTLYFGLAVFITFGGFADVRRMFRRLNQQHDRAPHPPP